MVGTSRDSGGAEILPETPALESVLLEGASLLASSLDYEETLSRVAEFAVRSLADFCVIDILEDGEIKRLEVAHARPDAADLTEQLLKFPLTRNLGHMASAVLQTGGSELVPVITPEYLDSISQGPEHRLILERLNPRSLMAVPLVAHERLLGVLQFVSTTRSYGVDDLKLAERLGQLAGLEVDNARLYREAQKALLARDRVLGIVAHDLRNPLNIISMSAELLLEGTLPEERRAQQLQVILRSVKRMNRLIQDLLDVARIEADRLFLQREPHEPERLAQEAVELSVALAAVKPLSLSLKCIDNPGPVLVDRDRILQVLGNLIGNAIKFTPAGGQIELRVEPAGKDVCFTVTDTGPGIDEEDLPHLFQPFWQAQNSLEGAGLGLMIARGIVEAHGGTIGVKSTPGEGSSFSFTIPAGPQPPRQERRRGVERRAERRKPNDGLIK